MIDYDRFLNPRVKEMPQSGIRKFFDIAGQMEDCISLGVGEPDFVTPWEIRDQAIKSIQAGHTQYTSNAGMPRLRDEIARYLGVRFALSYDPKSEIIVTVGASEAIDLTLRTLVQPGDEVLVPSPSYVSYCPNVSLVGGTPVAVYPSCERRFKLTPEDIERAVTARTRVLILPYPNNPTGAIMTREDLEAIAPVIEKHDLFVISDEIYAELTYGRRHVSIASIGDMRERTAVVSGFSKAFAMTGWRLGYLAAPVPVTEQVYKIHQYTIMCAPTCAQYGGYAALTEGQKDGFRTVEEMRAAYDMRRRYMVSAFREMGMDCFEPEGAFYLFPSIARFGLDAETFARRLLLEQRVATVPGTAFGKDCNDFLRCSYASSMKALKTACARIARFLAELH